MCTVVLVGAIVIAGLLLVLPQCAVKINLKKSSGQIKTMGNV